jgi:hypothetical protein
MPVEYDEDVLTVAHLLMDRYGAGAMYRAMSRLRLCDKGELDAWREVVSAIEDLQAVTVT